MDLPKGGLVRLRHAQRGEERANDQQQARCEPNMASRKNRQLGVLSPGAAMCSAHGTLVTFCELHASRISTA